MGASLSLVGQRFGMLVVTERLAERMDRLVVWRTSCDCGGTSVVPTGNLRSGNSTSCGCRKRAVLGESTTKHGRAHTPTYTIWQNIKSRCLNPANARYVDYGGRGITLCASWHTFEGFYRDMGDRPEGMTLDRLNNSEGYSKSNCAWVTYAQNNRNKRNTRWITYEGVRLCAADWAKRLGICPSTLNKRLNKFGESEAIRRSVLCVSVTEGRMPFGTTVKLEV